MIYINLLFIQGFLMFWEYLSNAVVQQDGIN